jgi:hypothetical protein
MYDTLYASPYLAPQYETVNFENAGSATWNVPANIQTLHAQAIGGGGSGVFARDTQKVLARYEKSKKSFMRKLLNVYTFVSQQRHAFISILKIG